MGPSHKHHHRRRHARELRQEFGVAAKGDAGVVDHALVHRPGDQRRSTAAFAQRHGLAQRVEHIGGVERVQGAGADRRPQRHRADPQAARAVPRRPGSGPEFLDLDGQAQAARPLAQQSEVGDDHQFGRQAAAGDEQGQVRADTGGFAGRQKNPRVVGAAHGRDPAPRLTTRRSAFSSGHPS